MPRTVRIDDLSDGTLHVRDSVEGFSGINGDWLIGRISLIPGGHTFRKVKDGPQKGVLLAECIQSPFEGLVAWLKRAPKGIFWCKSEQFPTLESYLAGR